MLKKDMAMEFLQMAWSGAVSEAFEQFVHADFIHHNAYFEDGDLVAVHSKVALDPEQLYSVIHIFRFEDGKIIEEWESAQEVPKDSPNENGIF